MADAVRSVDDVSASKMSTTESSRACGGISSTAQGATGSRCRRASRDEPARSGGPARALAARGSAAGRGASGCTVRLHRAVLLRVERAARRRTAPGARRDREPARGLAVRRRDEALPASARPRTRRGRPRRARRALLARRTRRAWRRGGGPGSRTPLLDPRERGREPAGSPRSVSAPSRSACATAPADQAEARLDAPRPARG